VLVVDANGTKLGVKALPDALRIAREADLDLVEVAPMANPPVCRIMDYGRFKYENELRAKESRRKTTNVGIKEMKYRPKIGSGDFNTKTRQVARFLGEGHKVKVTIMFRGREMSHPELGKKILDKVAEDVVALAKVEAAPKLDGRNMIMVLAPDKRAQQEAAKAAAAAEAEGTEGVEGVEGTATDPATGDNAGAVEAPAATVAPAVAPEAAEAEAEIEVEVEMELEVEVEPTPEADPAPPVEAAATANGAEPAAPEPQPQES
jgi:translation initiation factor IF-3